MKVIEVSSAKGGVGTTTVACSLALALATKSPERVLLLDLSKNDDCTAVLGLGTNSTRENNCYGMTIQGLTRKEMKDTVSVGDYDFVVIDAGTETTRQYGLGIPDLRVQVVRNEYMSLRAETLAGRDNFGACVVLYQKDNALTVKDVQMVLRNVPTVFEISSNVSRAIDAGLLASRDKLWGEWTDSIIETHFSEVMN
jgi:MinD-like ATPase involved in chromosome partitioning or flagellar assembly